MAENESDSSHMINQGTPGNPPPVPPVPAGVPLVPSPNGSHALDDFPVVVVVLLHIFTCGIFTLIWLNLLHGKMPKVRHDDPSAGKAIGFCFIPFFNLYWIFFSYRRLCLRLDEQRVLHGLPPSNLTGMATVACIFQVIPYVNLLGSITTMPIFAGMVQSSVNQLVKTARAATPPGTQPPVPPAKGMPTWGVVLLICGCLALPMIFIVALLAGLLLPALAKAKQKAELIKCCNNLKQAGLAFGIWEGDNYDLYPFNVSTNSKGTLEVCDRGANGFDKNSYLDFQVMSNELSDPNILICPMDHSKTPALNFSQLQPGNVSYLVHSGTNVSDANPQNVLAICPFHHNVLLVDGSVQQLNAAQMQKIMAAVAQDK